MLTQRHRFSDVMLFVLIKGVQDSAVYEATVTLKLLAYASFENMQDFSFKRLDMLYLQDKSKQGYVTRLMNPIW